MPLYYPLWIAVGGHNVIRRGPDGATPADAARVIKEKIAGGYASMGLVIKVDDAGRHEIMSSSIYPGPAKRIIGHYEDMLAALDRAEGLTRE